MLPFAQWRQQPPRFSNGPINEFLRVTREHLDMDVAFVGEFQAGKRVFRYVSCSMSDEQVFVVGADPLEETYCEKLAAGRIAELISDASKTPEVRDLRLTDELDIGAYIATPIVLSSGRLYATLCCFSKEAKPTWAKQSSMSFDAPSASRPWPAFPPVPTDPRMSGSPTPIPWGWGWISRSRPWRRRRCSTSYPRTSISPSTSVRRRCAARSWRQSLPG